MGTPGALALTQVLLSRCVRCDADPTNKGRMSDYYDLMPTPGRLTLHLCTPYLASNFGLVSQTVSLGINRVEGRLRAGLRCAISNLLLSRMRSHCHAAVTDCGLVNTVGGGWTLVLHPGRLRFLAYVRSC